MLSKPVDPEDTLNIIGGVPGGVEDDHPVSSNQVDPQRAGPCRNEKQATSGQVEDGRHKSEGMHTMEALASNGPLPDVAGVIEFFGPLLPCGSAGGTIQAIVVNVPEPLAITFTSTSQLESAPTVQYSHLI